MIGKVIIGKSFRGCLRYCLNDKQEQRHHPAEIMRDRVEILAFNNCFGTEKELIQQFNELRALNPKLSKPVMHISLGLAPGERLPEDKLEEIARGCAKEMGFENNQYIAVLHKDTRHQHMHIVVNRVGFDGRTLSDSSSYKRMADCCRKLEQKYGLQKVQSPKRFQTPEERKEKRFDQRKELLKEHIKQCLLVSGNLDAFTKNMRSLGYEVIKSRGIAFRDRQKVYTKGSEVGYSLAKLEKLLAQRAYTKRDSIEQEDKFEKMRERWREKPAGITLKSQPLGKPEISKELEDARLKTAFMLQYMGQQSLAINTELLEEFRKKRQKRQSFSLDR